MYLQISNSSSGTLYSSNYTWSGKDETQSSKQDIANITVKINMK